MIQILLSVSKRNQARVYPRAWSFKGLVTHLRPGYFPVFRTGRASRSLQTPAHPVYGIEEPSQGGGLTYTPYSAGPPALVRPPLASVGVA